MFRIVNETAKKENTKQEHDSIRQNIFFQPDCITLKLIFQ